MLGKDFKNIKEIFKRKINMALSVIVIFLIGGVISLSMTEEEIKKKAEEFRTEEYYYMDGEKGEGKNPLDTMNAAEAYAQGYTGKGVTLGIVDDYVNLSHREFINKDNSYVIGEIPEDIDWGVSDHGTHVAGIMSASKDGKGMHGVAFNSNFVSGDNFNRKNLSEERMLKEAYTYFNSREDIKIINNSWIFNLYIDEIHYTYDPKGYQGKKGILEIIEREGISNEIEILKNSMKKYNKLLILGNGNFGHITPALLPILSYLDEDVKNNIIGVTALNTSLKESNSGFLAAYSDLNKYNEENSISAPGTYINSVNAASSQKYIPMTGTSMATPMVTGVGGLVQEAFPYMTGKQIGDVLLSTASKVIVHSQKFVWTIQEEGEDFLSLSMIYFGEKPNSKEILKEDMKEYYEANKKLLEIFYLGSNSTVEEFLDIFIEENFVSIFENVPYEIVYGQGIVDAGKAVKGLGTLNARRLGKEDISSSNGRVKEYLSGKEQVLYTIDTMGYDSTWSNNISETKVG